MTGNMSLLIQEYGYWVIAFAAIIEGESILIAGGIAVKMGLLSLFPCIALAVVGSTLHDHFFFFLGRFGGAKLFQRWGFLYGKLKAMLFTIEKYGTWLILTFRYAYGLRTLVPAAIGMSKVSLKRFFVLDCIGGILWASTFLVGGYVFGGAFQQLFRRLDELAWWDWSIAIIVCAGIVVCVGIYYFYRSPAQADPQKKVSNGVKTP